MHCDSEPCLVESFAHAAFIPHDSASSVLSHRFTIVPLPALSLERNKAAVIDPYEPICHDCMLRYDPAKPCYSGPDLLRGKIRTELSELLASVLVPFFFCCAHLKSFPSSSSSEGRRRPRPGHSSWLDATMGRDFCP